MILSMVFDANDFKLNDNYLNPDKNSDDIEMEPNVKNSRNNKKKKFFS